MTMTVASGGKSVTITAEDARKFGIWLRTGSPRFEKLGENTARTVAKCAAQFFNALKRDRIIVENPFAKEKKKLRSNPERYEYVPPASVEKALAACKTQRWRVIIALAYYAGFRCPSEVCTLQWEDIDFDAGLMDVRAPKVEHHEGHERRDVPLFPEVRRELLALKAEAPPRASGQIIAMCDASAGANLREPMEDIIKRAGLVIWPKLFQNLRASREVDLCEIYPITDVCAWWGHSIQTAAVFYLKPKSETLARAGAENPVHNPVQSVSPTGGKLGILEGDQKTKNRENRSISALLRDIDAMLAVLKIPPRGGESVSDLMRENGVPGKPGADSGVFAVVRLLQRCRLYLDTRA